MPEFNPHHIQESDIIELTGLASYQRGEAYWQQNKVLSVKHVQSEQRIIAYVSGSGRNRYQQEIRYYSQAQELYLESTCSCPMGFDCKHVAAALLEFIHRYAQQKSLLAAKNSTTELDRWMYSAQRELQQKIPTEADKEFAVLYILNSQIQGQVTISLLKSRRLKKGGWSQPRHLSHHEFTYGFPYWCNVEDARLCTLASTQYKLNKIMLEGSTGAFILQQMLATGRCFWRDATTTPLHWSEPLNLQLDWQLQEERYTLNVLLGDKSDWKLIATEPLCYLDIDNNSIGIINTQLTAIELKQLMMLPAVPTHQANQLSHFLRQHLKKPELPTPVMLNEIKIEQPLVPHLTLCNLPLGSAKLLSAKLAFQYGNYVLTEAAENKEGYHLLEQNNQLIHLQRNVNAEIMAVTRLLNLGFIPGYQLGMHHLRPFQLLMPGSDAASITRQWLAFTETIVPNLQNEGWQIQIEDDFDLEVYDGDVEFDLSESTHNGWFEMSLNVEIGGQQLPLLPLLQSYLQQQKFDLSEETILLPFNDSWIRLPTQSIKPLISTLLELFDEKHKDETHLKLPFNRAALLNHLDNNRLRWQNAEQVHALCEKLKHFDGIQPVLIPDALNAKLRAYQHEGLNWLAFLREYSFGGILADDMGLGKTVQALAYLLHEKQQQRLKHPTLVIAPTSLVWNWQQEAQKFAPSLKILILHGNSRADAFSEIANADLVITTYPLIPRDIEHYRSQHYSAIILDEAQQVKNPRTKAAQSIRELKADMRLCLTGTPLENHLGELWSLFDFVQPGLLGTESFFRQHFRTPIEKNADLQRSEELKRRVAPFMLRRNKTQVVSELPQKTEIAQFIELDKAQRNLYETIRVSMEQKIRQLIQEKGLAKSHIEFLDALLKLRQVCCDTRLVKLKSAAKIATTSAKLGWLKENLPEMIEEGRRILIFSQFTSMLALIETELTALNIAFCTLTGQTRKRAEVIELFQSGEVPVFLISLKAGGTGLNLTTADVVIHYDPWWNPAVEQQATDRAYRIGQDKPVFVYKLIAKDTVEEKIQVMQRHKQQLANALFDAKQQNIWQGKPEQLLELLN